VLDQLGAEREHHRVFLSRVAVRHDDGHRHTGAPARESQRLAVIAAGRADDAAHGRPLSLEAIEIDDAAPHLEGTDRRVVLMLDHDLEAESRLK
jgi:hypothetical protein